MALIIHKVLFERLRQHSEWLKFKGTFQTLTGRELLLTEGYPRGLKKPVSAKIDVRGVRVGLLVVEDPGADPERARACWHLLTMAAEHFASMLALSNVHDHEHLPAVILQTCQWIRKRALSHEVRLREAAESAGLSAGHLSRLFHRSTA